MAVALTVHGVGEGHVGIVEHAINIVRRGGHFTGGCQQLFLGGAEDVGSAAADIVQTAAVALQGGAVGIELFHGLVGDRHDLRRCKAGRGIQLNIGAHDSAHHGLILGDTGVLVAAAHGVVAESVSQDRDLFLQLHIAKELLGTLAQLTGKGGILARQLLRFFQIRLPKLVGGVNVADGPLVLLADLRTFGNLFGFCHGSYLL